LSAISEPGAVVADVARREDVCTSLIYKWRRAMEAASPVIGSGFAPVVIEAAGLAPKARLPASDRIGAVIEVELQAGRVRIHAGAPCAAIATTLKALRP
jgi:transposase